MLRKKRLIDGGFLPPSSFDELDGSLHSPSSGSFASPGFVSAYGGIIFASYGLSTVPDRHNQPGTLPS